LEICPFVPCVKNSSPRFSESVCHDRPRCFGGIDSADASLQKSWSAKHHPQRDQQFRRSLNGGVNTKTPGNPSSADAKEGVHRQPRRDGRLYTQEN